MTLFHQTVPQFVKMLTNMEKFIDKAEALATSKKFEADVLLTTRLAPDMYPLMKQVQVACDMAKGCTARLAGQEPPKHDDNEKTFGDLRERLKKTTTYLKTFKPDDFKGAEDRRITIPWAPGKTMQGMPYATELMLPNFYFHTSMAYALFRHAGVDVGKGDFIGDIPMQ